MGNGIYRELRTEVRRGVALGIVCYGAALLEGAEVNQTRVAAAVEAIVARTLVSAASALMPTFFGAAIGNQT